MNLVIYIMLPFGSQTWLAGISPINGYVVVFYNIFMGKSFVNGTCSIAIALITGQRDGYPLGLMANTSGERETEVIYISILICIYSG